MLIEMKESVQGLWQDACNFVGEQKNKIAAAGAMVAGNAMAAIDTTAVEAGITAAKSSAEGVGGLVVAAVAGLVVIGLIIGIVRKL